MRKGTQFLISIGNGVALHLSAVMVSLTRQARVLRGLCWSKMKLPMP